jgi:hypothetical protein
VVLGVMSLLGSFPITLLFLRGSNNQPSDRNQLFGSPDRRKGN